MTSLIDASLAASSTRGIHELLNPRSVAVIGASRRADTVGGALFANLLRDGFTGEVYPINPTATEVLGKRAYPDILAVGKPIDLAVIIVPAALVEKTVQQCVQAGVKGLVVITSGFAESSPEGRATERRIRDALRAADMRMVGPNCMGVINTDPAVRLNSTFTPVWPPAGNIGMLSQSGALGLAMLQHAVEWNLGISTFISVGNKADVSGNDLLAYWADDPRTQVIVLYLESFGNPRKFARIAPEVVRRKPIVAVKSGRSAAGTRAAASHSAALANLDVAVDALFDQAGVIRTNTLEELYDVAALLSTQPVPAGPRVGVVTNAGGPGILLADACEAHGLALPAPAPETLATLRAFLPPHAGLANPIDMAGSDAPADYSRAIEAMGADPSIDSVIVIFIPPLTTTKRETVAQAIAESAGRLAAHKPIATVFLSQRGAPSVLSSGPRGRIPSFSYPENAAMALAAAYGYGQWRKRPVGEPLTLRSDTEATIRMIVDDVLADAEDPVWVGHRDLSRMLDAIGIPFAPAVESTPDSVLNDAERMGYPLVLKAIAPGIVHKSDAGAVVLHLNDVAEVAVAVKQMRERLAARNVSLDAMLLQREIRGGIEALVGVTTDPTFGPLVVCGMGGVHVELLRDVSFRLTPVTDVDAREMIDRLRSSKLLAGFRGSPPGDRAALESVILRVSALVRIVPELLELDLNPVKVLMPGQGAIAVDGRMRLARVNGSAGKAG